MKVFFINISSFCNADFADALLRYSHEGKPTEIYYYDFENLCRQRSEEYHKWADREREIEKEWY